jgi:hypothetical protein
MEVALALGATGEPQSLVRLHEAGQPSLDVRELIEESEFLRSAVEAVRHHSNYFPPDQDLQSLVQQGIDILAEAAALLRDSPSDGTSTTARSLQLVGRLRLRGRTREITARFRTLRRNLWRAEKSLYVMYSRV